MKKTILILLFLIWLLSGCVYQAELRPEYNDTDVWICENPYTELYWSKSQGNIGVFYYADTQYNITHEETSGPLIWIYTAEAKDMRNLDEQKEYKLFKGRADYEEKNLTIEIQEDFKNIFNGELPTLEFKRYNKEEYLKDKE